MKLPRLPFAVAGLSAAGLVTILAMEGYVGTALVPTENDRPTVGFGSTFRDDGAPVRMGDTIDPVRAVQRTAAHIDKDTRGLKRCITGETNQVEADLIIDFSYQYGVSATCRSSMVRHINAGRYVASCEAYTLYKFSGGYDCSTPGNKRCYGVWTRNLKRQADCMGAQ